MVLAALVALTSQAVAYMQYAYFTQNAGGQPYPNLPGYANGVGTNALFNAPQGMFSSDDGSVVLVADTNNNVIRSVNPRTFAVSVLTGKPPVYIGTYGIGTNTVAYYSGNNNGVGTKAQFNNPSGGAFSQSNSIAYVADTSSCIIRQLQLVNNTAVVTTLAGR